jgi:hypothetical protein
MVRFGADSHPALIQPRSCLERSIALDRFSEILRAPVMALMGSNLAEAFARKGDPGEREP